MTTLAIVQARLGSSRLPQKVARPLGGVPLLKRVIERLGRCQRLSQIIVATGDSPANQPIHDLVADTPADVFVGSESDVLGRFAAVCRAYQPRAIVRICADNPFVDPGLIDELVYQGDFHPEADYISHRTADGRPVILSPLGLFGEWCRTEAILQADAEATDPADREHVTRYLYGHPEKFTLRLLALPVELEREDLRLTVDFEDDWEHAVTVDDAVDKECTWRDLLDYIDQQKTLREEMAALNRIHRKA